MKLFKSLYFRIKYTLNRDAVDFYGYADNA